MGEGALLLGPALADGRTVLPPVEPVSHGGESETADLLFVVSMTTAAAAELPAASVGFLCLCCPCAKLQRSLADLHRVQAVPVPYAHSAVTPAFLQASHAHSLHDHDRELVVDVGVDAELVSLPSVSLPSILPEPCISCGYHRITSGLPLPSQTHPPRSPGVTISLFLCHRSSLDLLFCWTNFAPSC